MINSIKPNESPRVGFRKGWLYFYYKGELHRFQAWPTPVAECRGSDGEWSALEIGPRDRFFSYLNSGPYGYYGQRYLLFRDTLWEVETLQRVAAELLSPQVRRLLHADTHFQKFLGAVPHAVREKAQAMQCDLFSVIELFARVPAAMDLAAEDVILTAALARHWEFPAVGRVNWSGLGRVTKQRRRDIVAWLGYPCRESIVKLLRRVELISPPVGGERLRQAFRVLSDPHWAPALAHFDEIHEVMINFLDRPHTRHWFPVSWLQTKGRRLDSGEWRVLDSINDLITAEVLDVAAAKRIRLHRPRLVELTCLLPLLKSHSFPVGPLSVNTAVEPLIDAWALMVEGKEMANCLGSIDYLLSALKGRLAFYRVMLPVRATLALRPCAEGGWVVDDVRGPSNAELTPAALVAIAESFPEIVGFDELRFNFEEAVA